MYVDSTGSAAMVLFDKDAPGHIGALVEDEFGNWWHFYWGTTRFWGRAGCVFGFRVKANSWCVRYNGPITLRGINNASQFSGKYEDYVYLQGDFSKCVEQMKIRRGNTICIQIIVLK